MNSNYSFISNSSAMLILCSVVIVGVIFQALYFLRFAFKRGNELNIESNSMKQIVTSSAVFSIIPSLPILISYLILISALGKYLPWVRLSVIGSAAYETMAADMAVKAYGYSSLSDPFSPEAYVGIAWTVTIAILLSALSSFLLKPYDKKMQTMKENKFMPYLISAMFLGLLGSMSAPYLVNFKNLSSIIAIVTSAISVLVLGKIGQNSKVIKEFAFPVSMVIGMVSAAVFTALVG